MIRTERDLAGLAAALVGTAALTPAERKLCRNAARVDSEIVESTRQLIVAGDDPLGDLFGQIRAAEARRSAGATYTPGAIVNAMIEWAANEVAEPVRVVDPGAGSGRYLMAAARQFPNATLVAVEIDPLAALLLRANAAVQGFESRLSIRLEDYRLTALEPVDGPTLYIGNPPYVRHHDIGEVGKDWFGRTAAALGFKASKLAGLHIHFFLKTRSIAAPGDFGAFITAAEWMDVNYGGVLRQMLGDGLGGTALHIIDPKAMPFADAMTTAAISCFRVGNRPDEFTVRAVESLDELAPLSTGRAVSWADMARARKWSVFTRDVAPKPDGHIELGELFRVHRGQVTGANSVWVAGPHAADLPARFLLPAVTRARELIAAGPVLKSARDLRRVINLPMDLSTLPTAERRVVERFLKWAREQGADEGYVARQRKAWWAVTYKDPAPILSTYMGRRPPHFARNAAGARHINIAHGLYPREPMDTETLDQVVRFLHMFATTEGGRAYAGGLIKFEPGELERLTIPRLEDLGELTAEVDTGRVRGGRGNRDGQLPA
jgi:N-6 DNA Methylase